jgi:membrane protease YdiL (CAAX protease family)
MEEMEIAINAITSDVIKSWMNWMIIIFLSSIFFTYKHVTARFIFIAFFITVPISIIIFNITKSPYLVGASHIIVWLPLAIYLFKVEIKGKTEKLKSIYGIYLILFLATIIVSLFFDIRDTILILLGMKDPFI